MFPKLNLRICILSTALLAMTHGCDDTATQIAREAADRQAQQNTEMAHLNKEVASGTHQLVEADAKARKEIVSVHHDLQAERARLDTSRSQLESERREIAGQRRTESMLIPVTGLLLLVVLLGFCWYALVASQRRENSDAQLTELLIQEIVPNDPSLLSSNLPSLLSHAQPDKRPVE